MMTACEYKDYLVCMLTDTNNDLIMCQQYANSARSEQSYLTSIKTFINSLSVARIQLHHIFVLCQSHIAFVYSR